MASATLTVGRYALFHEIASGGMAVVHVGRLLGPVGFAKTVAVKRLHPHLSRNPEFVAMFLDEARLAARIRHPNVVSTLDVVATEGELFVVMEYVPGESLARLLHAAREQGERVPLPVAASIMVDVLHGLHAAHEACDERGKLLGLVHRDVSPHNILVGTDCAAHLIDFGIAKAAGRAQVTREGQLKGKLAYMAPEQLSGGGRVDRRADVFGAAVVFWEILTGQRLFDGEDEGEIYGKVLRAEVVKPSARAGGDRNLADAIVLRGLARDPDKRYATARAMALSIEEALPLAPPSQLGQWVERLGGEGLAERARSIASVDGVVEGTGTVRVRPPSPDAAAVATAPGGRMSYDEASLVATQPGRAFPIDGSQTDTSLVSSELEAGVPARPRRAYTLAAAAAAVGLVLITGLAVEARAPRSAGEPSLLSGRASSVAQPDESAPAPLPPAPPAPAAVQAPAQDDAIQPSALPLAPPPRHIARPAAPVSVPRTKPAACDPPYVIDANGYRKYKRECANE